MRVLILVIVLFSFLISNGQKTNSCQILGCLLEYEPAKKPYYFDKNTSYPIIFYDTAKIFNDCIIHEHYGRKIEVSHNYSNTASIKPSDYIITILSKTKRIYKILLHYKNSGAYCSFTLKRKKNGFKVISFRERYL